MLAFAIGRRVEKTMGIRETGIVIRPFVGPFTDGQYRLPYRHERPVYVQWDDGTRGWIQREFLRQQ